MVDDSYAKEYLEHVKEMDGGKYRLYAAAYETLKNKPLSHSDLKMSLMCKAREVYSQLKLGRPRMLFVPTFRARVVGGIITYFLNSILHEFKFCTLGKDNSQMAEEVPRSPNMYYVSSDGKAHDSHMHASLIQRWVHPLFKEFKHIFNHEFITLSEFEMVFKNIDTRFESI